jgi:pimeloyl-ACP methyl ester carboxylesterase
MKALKWTFRVLGILLVSGLAIFFLGPRPSPIVLDPLIEGGRLTLTEAKALVAQEANLSKVKPGNDAIIVWSDTLHQKTDYALVYLHGFSASRGEGDPIHLDFARRYKMNAYLARLDGHGLAEKDALLAMTPASLLNSAKEAIKIGHALGDKVIVMSCSTGGTLALYLAAYNRELIDGLICYSPNIDIYDPTSHLIDGPWGKQILKMVEGGDYHQWDATEDVQKFWTTSYRNEALIDLRQLLDVSMTQQTFSMINQPLLLLYYYKSEDEQDHVVSIEAMKKMYSEIATPETYKRQFAVPQAGHHVIASKYQSEDLESVRKYTFQFAEEVLNLPVSDN